MMNFDKYIHLCRFSDHTGCYSQKVPVLGG